MTSHLDLEEVSNQRVVKTPYVRTPYRNGSPANGAGTIFFDWGGGQNHKGQIWGISP